MTPPHRCVLNKGAKMRSRIRDARPKTWSARTWFFYILCFAHM